MCVDVCTQVFLLHLLANTYHVFASKHKICVMCVYHNEFKEPFRYGGDQMSFKANMS